MPFFRQYKAAARDEWQFLSTSLWDRVSITIFPVLTLFLLASLFSSAVPSALPVLVVDHSVSPVSRAIKRAVQASSGIEVIAGSQDFMQAWSQMRRAEAYAMLYLTPHLEQQIVDEQTAKVFIFYNASFSLAGNTLLNDLSAAIKQVSQELTLFQVAAVRGVEMLKPAPVNVQLNLLYNPAKNFEMFLLGVLMPGVLVLMLSVAVMCAFGRELRDKTVGQWLERHQGQLLAAMLGKASPYILLYCFYGIAALLWLSYLRGDGVQGSLSLLLIGTVLLYLSYAALAVMFIALLKRMVDAFSIIGLYVGTAVAFSGATFPIDGAPWFAKLWHQLLPLSAYLKLDAAERYIDAHWSVALVYLAVLLIFVLLPAAIAYLAYRDAIADPDCWGRR